MARTASFQHGNLLFEKRDRFAALQIISPWHFHCLLHSLPAFGKATRNRSSAVDMDTSCRYNIVRSCPGSWNMPGRLFVEDAGILPARRSRASGKNQLPRILAKGERIPRAIRRSE